MGDLMDHFVMLDKLPEGIEFPHDLRDKIRFDAQSKKLCFQGYMSKTEFDRLCLITKDWGFRRKLEELFQVCVYEDDSHPKGVRGFLSMFKRSSGH
jgi:hypothetical protein